MITSQNRSTWIFIGIMVVGAAHIHATDAATRATDDAVAAYMFAGNANDSSGNGNNGTVQGAVLDNDRFGNTANSYDFDGSSAVITVPDQLSLNISGPIAISVWIYPDTLPGSNTMILGKSNFTTTTNYILRLLPGGNLQWEYDSSLITSSSPISAGGWFHIVVMSDAPAGASEIWVNGTLVLQSPSGTPGAFGTVASQLSIGAATHSSGAEHFDGRIDDLRLYSHTFTPAEIAFLYAEITPVELQSISVE